MLHRMKAEDGHMRDTAHPPAAVFRAQRVAGILDHDQPMTIRDFVGWSLNPQDGRRSPRAESLWFAA